jgi:hypothetical protein
LDRLFVATGKTGTGTTDDKHRLSEFKLSYVDFKNGTVIVNDHVTMTTLGADKLSGIGNPSIKDIPILIKIFNVRTITIGIDKNKINSHFGNCPIFGTVTDQG